MNKKTITMLTSLTVGGTLLFGTVMASATQLSSYETYKTSIKDTIAVKNETADITASVTDNGTELVSLTESLKRNETTGDISNVATTNISGVAKTIASYTQDGKDIRSTNVENEYTVRDNKDKKDGEEIANPQMVKGMEVVIDTLVGTMKDNVVVNDNSDGTKNVTLNLKNTEITPLVNAVASMALSGGSDMAMHNEKSELGSIKDIAPKLVSDIKVESVDSSAVIDNNNVISKEVAKVVLSGKDADGKEHKIVVDINLNLSKIGSTTPDKLDLAGKQIKTVTEKFEKR
ncbi:hypothetical protein [Clostridium gasigenes]|uniref:Uncharacterized protein n=1 Tax=Clostridium gasigenes TaxID=94869 RepID=A0A1H0QKH1_9CLOT|nr:hypothetical protein [Clostridium gasigenes]MBU3108043.1 hypothetical protein [Clostridium gasigenes]SDP17881.1 hypothetical protein SAMN04488529_102407 [Clostridium gasigenes]